MKPTLTFRESRVIRSARECAEQCDVSRARRTDPTPMQQQLARIHWYDAKPLLVRIAHLFRVNREPRS